MMASSQFTLARTEVDVIIVPVPLVNALLLGNLCEYHYMFKLWVTICAFIMLAGQQVRCDKSALR